MRETSRKPEAEQPAKIHWASRLPPRLLARLYESDAMGFRDMELCEDVGLRLYERCRTFVLVSRKEVECPTCRQIFSVSSRGRSHCPNGDCDWFTTQRTYLESIRNHYAHTGRAIEAFARFHHRYPAARSYRARISLIDELIHSFHVEEATHTAVKSAASKLLEGNKTAVVRFLDRLSAVDPDGNERWRRALSRTIHARLLNSPPNDE